MLTLLRSEVAVPEDGHTSTWSALESLPGQTAVAATWRRHLGSSLEAFQSAFLHPLPEPASSVPCPHECGCWHEVIRHKDGELVGVCRCESWSCDDLALTAEETTLWTLSWPRLGHALCQAFGLQSKRADLHLPATNQIGAWSADAVPVLLTLQTERADFLFVAGQLAARLRQPFILLAPTSHHLDAAAKELLANVGAGFFDLSSHIEFTANGQLRSRVPPGELFARFTPQPKEALEESTARKAFALVKALDSEQPASNASLYTVFRLYCMEGLNAVQVARKCRCGRSLVFLRLKALREKLGVDPRTLRQYSGHLERIEESLADPRARRVHRRTAVYGEQEEED
jgi:hypothetical protein